MKANSSPQGHKFRSHDRRTEETTDDWITPPELLASLGKFDLDPCASQEYRHNFEVVYSQTWSMGLEMIWNGRVWLNPPYGNAAAKWVKKLAEHGDGIALVFARTETEMWMEDIWAKATGILFLEGRVPFLRPNGTCPGPAGSPSALIAYGMNNLHSLMDCGLRGAVVSSMGTQKVGTKKVGEICLTPIEPRKKAKSESVAKEQGSSKSMTSSPSKGILSSFLKKVTGS